MAPNTFSRRPRRYRLIGLGAIALALSGAGIALVAATSGDDIAETREYSNIYREDYVGPDVCAECHEENAEGWRGGLHRTMNSLGDANVGNFEQVTIRYAGGSAHFYRLNGKPHMDLTASDGATRWFRVTRTIGARYLQEYVGVELDDTGAVVTGKETRLPFGFWLADGRWYHRQYFDSWYKKEYLDDGSLAIDPFAPDEEPWAQRCAWCHNTYPFDIRMVRSHDNPVGQGREQYFLLRRSPRSAAQRESIRSHNQLPVQELVTVGISCESCHLGGREHAENDEDISFLPRSADIALRGDAPDLSGGRDNPLVINSVCAQCHSTPAPTYASGGVMRNSSEALDMAAGSCMSRIKCTHCHDPHQRGPGAGAGDQGAHLDACRDCHRGEAAAGAEHSGHSDEAASCLDCHMPKIVKGVTEAVRSHRISVPVEEKMLATESLNACNLCHLDRPLGWTLTALRDRWGISFPSEALWMERYGDEPVGDHWLESDEANTRAIALSAYSRSTLGRNMLDRLTAVVDDDIAFYRMWNLFALERILQRKLSRDEFDPTAAPGRRWKTNRHALLRRSGIVN